MAQAAAEAARKAGAIVMADEVQTGIGRTGTFLASEQLGFNPEVVTLAKGIAGGVPMGAMLFRGKANGVFVAGDHQSTFAGNPLACAAGNIVIDTLTKENFWTSGFVLQLPEMMLFVFFHLLQSLTMRLMPVLRFSKKFWLNSVNK